MFNPIRKVDLAASAGDWEESTLRARETRTIVVYGPDPANERRIGGDQDATPFTPDHRTYQKPWADIHW